MKNSGLLFIDKPVGLTSRDVDFQMMRKFHTKKVGHLGTLDPFATGLLIVAINEGTKLLSTLTESQKTYEATLVLGVKKDSGDITGNTTEEKEVPLLNEELINNALSSFIGESMQTPPIYSAIKKDGRPLYSYARNNEVVEIESRKINIKELSLISFNKDDNSITFKATVSKGTYIRTLGEDIAKKLNTVGYLKDLRRLAIDHINIEDDFVSTIEEPNLISITESASIFNIPTFPFLGTFVGQKKHFDCNKDYLLAIDNENNPIAIYNKDNDSSNLYSVKRGFSNE